MVFRIDTSCIRGFAILSKFHATFHLTAYLVELPHAVPFIIAYMPPHVSSNELMDCGCDGRRSLPSNSSCILRTPLMVSRSIDRRPVVVMCLPHGNNSSPGCFDLLGFEPLGLEVPCKGITDRSQRQLSTPFGRLPLSSPRIFLFHRTVR